MIKVLELVIGAVNVGLVVALFLLLYYPQAFGFLEKETPEVLDPVVAVIEIPQQEEVEQVPLKKLGVRLHVEAIGPLAYQFAVGGPQGALLTAYFLHRAGFFLKVAHN
jgi:hypothetical protein